MGLGLCRALHRHVPRRGRAPRRADAGEPGRAGVAGVRQRATRVMVEEAMLPLADASRRPAARRALPGGLRARRAAAARDLARADAGGPAAADRAEPARHLGPAGHHALRPRPALQPRPARAAARRCPVHAAGVDERALHAAHSTGSGWCAGPPSSSASARGCGRALPASSSSRRRKELMGAIPKAAPARRVERLATARRHQSSAVNWAGANARHRRACICSPLNRAGTVHATP